MGVCGDVERPPKCYGFVGTLMIIIVWYPIVACLINLMRRRAPFACVEWIWRQVKRCLYLSRADLLIGSPGYQADAPPKNGHVWMDLAHVNG